MVILILGWVVWAALAVYVAVLWHTKFSHGNGGVKFLAGRCALLLTLALVLSASLNWQKLHLLWLAPVIYVLSMTWNGMVLDARIKRAPKRAAGESERTGEAAEDILQRELTRWGYGPDTEGNA